MTLNLLPVVCLIPREGHIKLIKISKGLHMLDKEVIVRVIIMIILMVTIIKLSTFQRKAIKPNSWALLEVSIKVLINHQSTEAASLC